MIGQPLPPPTDEERARAREAAAAMRRAIADRTTMGKPIVTHLDYARPRRAEWWTCWPGLPGLLRVNGQFRHSSLPGWWYHRHEVRSELIPDLEALAEHGVRPEGPSR